MIRMLLRKNSNQVVHEAGKGTAVEGDELAGISKGARALQESEYVSSTCTARGSFSSIHEFINCVIVFKCRYGLPLQLIGEVYR